jgi:hypothetical protein
MFGVGRSHAVTRPHAVRAQYDCKGKNANLFSETLVVVTVFG